MALSIVEPVLNLEKFTCPSCGVLAMQRWSRPVLTLIGFNSERPFTPPSYKIARCDACEDLSFWDGQQLIFPIAGIPELANDDMPLEIKQDFDEAGKIFHQSPRASAALLRLSIQRLCQHLGLPGKNLNADIAQLIERGLPEQIKQSLDVVRVIGNEQVHPGTLDVRDDLTIARSLFKLVNLITEYLISNPKRISELYDSLPAGAREQIDKRDLKVNNA